VYTSPQQRLQITVLTLEAKCALAVDVVQHKLVLPLFGVGQLRHADDTLGTIEPI